MDAFRSLSSTSGFSAYSSNTSLYGAGATVMVFLFLQMSRVIKAIMIRRRMTTIPTKIHSLIFSLLIMLSQKLWSFGSGCSGTGCVVVVFYPEGTGSGYGIIGVGEGDGFSLPHSKKVHVLVAHSWLQEHY